MIVSRWSDKFQDSVSKSFETASGSYTLIKIIPFNNNWWKEIAFWNVMLCCEKRNFVLLLIIYPERLKVTDLKRYCKYSFCRIYKNKIFCTKDVAWGTPNLSLSTFFVLGISYCYPVIARKLLYCNSANF